MQAGHQNLRIWIGKLWRNLFRLNMEICVECVGFMKLWLRFPVNFHFLEIYIAISLSTFLHDHLRDLS